MVWHDPCGDFSCATCRATAGRFVQDPEPCSEVCDQDEAVGYIAGLPSTVLDFDPASSCNVCTRVWPLYGIEKTYHVSSSEGIDSNDGETESSAWATLEPVQAVLAQSRVCKAGVRIKFKRGDTWAFSQAAGNGVEDASGNVENVLGEGYPLVAGGESVNAMLVVKASGLEGTPLILESYGDAGDDPPLLDGLQGGGAGDPDEETDDSRGLVLQDCCHVVVRDIELRGFRNGVVVRGACTDVTLLGLSIHDNASKGLFVTSGAGNDDEYFDNLGDTVLGAPSYVTVDGCEIYDNGLDTGSANVEVKNRPRYCTFANNAIYVATPDERGGGGLMFHGSTWGNEVYDNDVHDNSDWPGGSGGDGWGVALKAARVPPEDDEELADVADYDALVSVAVHDNTIANNGDHAGILIYRGSDKVHVYNNAIYGNAYGVKISCGMTTTPQWDLEYEYEYEYELASGDVLTLGAATPTTATERIYVYRNLIYDNDFGVNIVTDELDTCRPLGSVRDVWVVHNTIASNRYEGFYLVAFDRSLDGPADVSLDEDGICCESTDSSGACELEIDWSEVAGSLNPQLDWETYEVTDIYVLNNIFYENGSYADYDGSESTLTNHQYLQVYVYDELGDRGFLYRSDGAGNGGTTLVLDGNCYYGWPTEDGTSFHPVVQVYNYNDGDVRYVESASSDPGGSVAELNTQTSDAKGPTFGNSLEDSGIEEDPEFEDPATSDYHLAESSPCIGAAIADTFGEGFDSTTALLHYETDDEVSDGPDYDGRSFLIAAPEIGALEYIYFPEEPYEATAAGGAVTYTGGS